MDEKKRQEEEKKFEEEKKKHQDHPAVHHPVSCPFALLLCNDFLFYAGCTRIFSTESKSRFKKIFSVLFFYGFLMTRQKLLMTDYLKLAKQTVSSQK